MSDFICPICNAEYSQKQKICTCGFEGIEYIDYYNNTRIQLKTKWMPPSKFRETSMIIN